MATACSQATPALNQGLSVQGFCSKVVIDAFDAGILQSTVASHTIDFTTAEEEDLHDIRIPLNLVCKGPQVRSLLGLQANRVVVLDQRRAW